MTGCPGSDDPPGTIAVTGACGNLGDKLLRHLAGLGAGRLVGLDLRMPPPGRVAAQRRIAADHGGHTEIDFVSCDLTDAGDARWRSVVESVDAVVHLAAQNPYPEASWADAAASLDMTANVALAASEAPGERRFVFATSNHVMGRYKDPPLSSDVAPGGLHPGLPPGVGTVWHAGETAMDSTAYATAKLAGERLCQALAGRGPKRTSSVCIRIGWCQPGTNRPETLSAAGTPTQHEGAAAIVDESRQRDAAWFRGMWLSNRDFCQLFERALEADCDHWPTPCIVVNGMSANTGMAWSLDEARRWLGYVPQDDVTLG